MEGIMVQGTRKTSVVRYGGEVASPLIKVVQEHWYSPELKMDILSIVDDPRQATQTILRYTDIKLGDPDPALFQPPVGLYREVT